MIEWKEGEQVRLGGGFHKRPIGYVVTKIEFTGDVLMQLPPDDPHAREMQTLFEELGAYAVVWLDSMTAEGVVLMTAVMLCSDGSVRDMHRELLTIEKAATVRRMPIKTHDRVERGRDGG